MTQPRYITLQILQTIPQILPRSDRRGRSPDLFFFEEAHRLTNMRGRKLSRILELAGSSAVTHHPRSRWAGESANAYGTYLHTLLEEQFKKGASC